MLFKKKEKTNRKPSQAFSNDNQISYLVLKEFKTALNSYLKSVKSGRLFRNHALYDSPWFVMTGPENSGKSTLLVSSCLSFPFRYPRDNGGENLTEIKWFSGNGAVWLDFPGKINNSENTELFESVYRSLAKIRRKRPADGIVCIIDINCIINGSQESIRKTALDLRSKFDELIRYWGIELPVFCVFNKMDLMPGFTEFFDDNSANWSDQLLGATFATEQQNDLPRKKFNKEFDILCSSIKALYLKRSAKENDNTIRRLICSFLIQFEGLKAKAGEFFEELFKDDLHEGKPVFKGFYFVSCKINDIKGASSKDNLMPSKLSQTIICHPLNPHRNDNDNQVSGQKYFQKSAPLFTEKLFKEVFPNGTQVLMKTRSISKKGRIKYCVMNGIFSLVFGFLLVYLFFSFREAHNLYDKVNKNVSLISPQNDNLMEAYAQMQIISEMVERFMTFHLRGIPLSYGIGFIKTEKAYDKLKKIYFQQAYNLLGIPLAAYLEFEIKNISAINYNLTFDNYSNLYRYLKVYLSISEEIAVDRSRIDTIAIREIIENDFYPVMQNLIKAKGFSMNMKTILRKNIGLYCYFLKTGGMPLIEQNQLLVEQARSCLAQIPDARIIYKSIMSRLQKTAPSISISGLLGDGVILNTKNISTIYTQEGWARYVSKELEMAIKKPVMTDWVTGGNGVRNVVTDEKKLKSDLVSMYIDDICRQWLLFLESIYYQRGEGVSGTVQFLRKLSAENSEITVLLESILRASKVNTLHKEEAAINAAKDFAAKKYSSIKKNVPMVKDAIVKKDTLSKVDQFFKPLMVLVRSQDGSVGISAYREKLSLVSEKMISCTESKNFLEVFNGSDKDPLLSAWRESEKLINSLPEYLQPAMISVFRKPVEIAAETVLNSISEEIDEIWKRRVYNFYDKKLSGKYPFYKSKEDVSIDAAMEFLRPNTGLIYGFILNNLSSYLVKDGEKWKSRPVGCINLQFNEDFFEMLRKADKISSCLFNHDGSRKVQSVYFMPLPGNKVAGSLYAGKKEYKIVDGKVNLCFQWPEQNQSQGITLKLFIDQNYTDELSFNGDWALLRLIESAQINIQNSTSLIARWERNIQNMIILPYGVKVKFSETVLPFGEKDFFGIKCPERIIEKEPR